MRNNSPKTEPTLVIFCKRPMLNQGKQRLAAGIGAQAAYLIALELLNCTLEDAANWPGHVVITVSREEDVKWAEELLVGNYSVLAQTQPSLVNVGKAGIENLGQRINKIDKILRAQGHTQLVFIGTDSPMLTDAHYAQTIADLNEFDTVFSKADDGGVGIMANSIPWPELQDLAWSTSSLCSDITKLSYQNQHSVGFVSPSFDIDEVSDLVKTSQHLQYDKRASRIGLLTAIKTLSTL